MAKGFNWLASRVQKTLSTANAWTDLDLSANIPAGATGAILLIKPASGTSQNIGFRKNGQTGDYKLGILDTAQGIYFAPVDANRITEYYTAVANPTCYLVGYTDDQVVFFDTPVDKTSSVTSTTSGWVDVNVSANVPSDATGVIVQGFSSAKAGQYGVRMNGVTTVLDYVYGEAIAGLDASKIFEFEINNTDGSSKCYVLGYIKNCATFKATPASVTLPSSYGDVDVTTQTSASALTAIIYDGTMGGIRKNGSSDSNKLSTRTSDAYMVPVEIDSDQIFEAIIGGSNKDAYVIGYTVDIQASTGTNIKINIGDVWKDVTEMKINIGDVWKSVISAKINIGDVWKDIF